MDLSFNISASQPVDLMPFRRVLLGCCPAHVGLHQTYRSRYVDFKHRQRDPTSQSHRSGHSPDQKSYVTQSKSAGPLKRGGVHQSLVTLVINAHALSTLRLSDNVLMPQRG
jgi:hypothetical protein